MGRELRRKEEKRNKKIKKVENDEELKFEVKGSTFLKVASSIILILIASYYIMAVFITKEIDISDVNNKASEKKDEENSISNQILAANIFNQSEDTYYVYCYDFEDEDDGVKNAISGSQQTVYRVNTSDGLNSKYVTTEESNPNATGLDNLKIKNPTLLVISGDKITGYHEGRTKIMTFLSQ